MSKYSEKLLEQLYSLKLEKLYEMYKFLESQNIPK